MSISPESPLLSKFAKLIKELFVIFSFIQDITRVSDKKGHFNKTKRSYPHLPNFVHFNLVSSFSHEILLLFGLPCIVFLVCMFKNKVAYSSKVGSKIT